HGWIYVFSHYEQFPYAIKASIENGPTDGLNHDKFLEQMDEEVMQVYNTPNAAGGVDFHLSWEGIWTPLSPNSGVKDRLSASTKDEEGVKTFVNLGFGLLPSWSDGFGFKNPGNQPGNQHE